MRRPWAVTGVGLLMMAAGAFGMARGFMFARTIWPPEQDLIWIVIVDAIGIACGIFLLRGRNWARWLTLVWVGAHAAIFSVVNHREVLAHVVIFALLVILMLRSDVRAYFGGAGAIKS